MSHYCLYCGKGPFSTQGGLNKHIGQSNDCQEKDRVAFKFYTSTLWKNAPDVRNDRSSALSPPPDEPPGAQFEHLAQDILNAERDFSGEDMIGTCDLPNPQTEHTNNHPEPEETWESVH